MRCTALFAVVLLLGAAAPALAQGGSRDDPPRMSGEPRFDPRYGPPPGADAPFTPRRDFRPPLYDPPPRDAHRDARPPDTARRIPAPPPRPKSHSRRSSSREVARRAPPSHASRHVRRDELRRKTPHETRRESRYEPRYDPRDRGPPPPRDYDERRRERPHGRQAYRDEPRYDPRRDPRRDPRQELRQEPRYERRPASRHGITQADHRRELLREYESIVRRQMEIERELGGAPPRDRYSEAGRYRR